MTAYTGAQTRIHPYDICDSVQTIGLADGLFKDNQTLEYFAVPHSDKFTTIGAGAFEGLTGLKKLTALCDAAIIPEGSFADCASLADVRLSAGATDAQIAD